MVTGCALWATRARFARLYRIADQLRSGARCRPRPRRRASRSASIADTPKAVPKFRSKPLQRRVEGLRGARTLVGSLARPAVGRDVVRRRMAPLRDAKRSP